jgi:hypothetical protein
MQESVISAGGRAIPLHKVVAIGPSGTKDIRILLTGENEVGISASRKTEQQSLLRAIQTAWQKNCKTAILLGENLVRADSIDSMEVEGKTLEIWVEGHCLNVACTSYAKARNTLRNFVIPWNKALNRVVR